VIKALNISKKYGELNVLNALNLEVKKGEVVSIVGASGAGKTTLLQILGTLDKPNEGNLFINETDITLLNSKKLATFRNKEIGFIFQFHQLLPEFTALENVCIPAYIAGKSKSEAEKEALDYLKFLKLEHRINHKPAELSGGEQQRVAVARALINQPSVVLADEPSGNLDSKNAKELHDLFFELREKFDQTFIIVTHNEELANMADRKLTIQDGVIVE
jgi:lipoprotein-releasing system ATP-binding protein